MPTKRKAQNPSGYAVDDTPYFDFADPDVYNRVLGWLARCKADGGVYRVKIEKVRDDASSQQFGYLWGVVYPHLAATIREAWGYEKGEFTSLDAHELGKAQRLGTPIVNRRTGEVMEMIPRSTRTLDVKEMADYIDWLIKLNDHLGGRPVPPPLRKFDPPPPTIDDGPDADREIERLAETPERLDR